MEGRSGRCDVKLAQAEPTTATNGATTIGDALREARLAARLTQTELAAKLRVPQTVVSRRERATDLSWRVLKSHLEALGITITFTKKGASK